MDVVLTICSANYLAHAKVLGESLAKSNPGHKFVVGLVDVIPKEFELARWLPCEVIPAADLGIPEFQSMAEKYNIVELNTAVKPFYLEWLYRRNPAVETVMYLDPDIVVFGSLDALLGKLRGNHVVVTPHSCLPGGSALHLHYDIGMLCTGIYNLGFLATARSETTFAFLNWWQKRLVDHCYYRPGSGVFVDQQWVTLAPLYFDGVYVEKDPGYNMSYWNHFERTLSREGARYIVNGKQELVFYHFSNYNPLKPEVIANRPTEPTMSFAERPDLQPLYDDYRRRLLDAGFHLVRNLKCAYGRKPIPVAAPRHTVKTCVQGAVRKILGVLPRVIRMGVQRLTRFVADNCGN